MFMRVRCVGLPVNSSPTTTARYAHLTEVTEQDSLTTINRLINSLPFALGGDDGSDLYR